MSRKLVPAVLRYAAIVLIFGSISACEGARDLFASPANAAEVTAEVSRLTAAGKPQQAIEEGEDFLANQDDTSGKLAWELAKASAQASDVERVIRYADAALKAGAVSSVDLMSEPLLEPVRTQPRLVALAAGLAPQATQTSNPALQADSGDAKVSIGADGIEASAGDVSVKLPD